MAITGIKYREWPLRKIVLVNKTRYSTRDIKRLVRSCVERLLDWPPSWTVEVYVKYENKGSGCSGSGCVGCPGIWLNLNRWRYVTGTDNVGCFVEAFNHRPEDLARTIFHELEHNIGKRHGDVMGGYDTSWAANLPLRYLGKQKRKSVTDPDTPTSVRWDLIRQKRETHARRMLNRCQTKLKRMKTQLKKWQQKVKYYERIKKGTTSIVRVVNEQPTRGHDHGTVLDQSHLRT